MRAPAAGSPLAGTGGQSLSGTPPTIWPAVSRAPSRMGSYSLILSMERPIAALTSRSHMISTSTGTRRSSLVLADQAHVSVVEHDEHVGDLVLHRDRYLLHQELEGVVPDDADDEVVWT